MPISKTVLPRLQNSNNMSLRVLVVIAHPDDELFVSGTIALLAERGFELDLVCLTDGGAGSSDLLLNARVGCLDRLREKELRCSAEMLGIERVWMLGYKDAGSELGLESRRDSVSIVDRLRECLEKMNPAAVITHGSKGGYGHPAHLLLHQAVLAAVKLFRGRVDVYSFAAAIPNAFFSWHFDDRATVVVDVSEFVEQRAAALNYHQSQKDYFLQPYYPKTFRKLASAAVGYITCFKEYGRQRIPIHTAERFFALFRYEGLCLHIVGCDQKKPFFERHFEDDSRFKIS